MIYTPGQPLAAEKTGFLHRRELLARKGVQEIRQNIFILHFEYSLFNFDRERNLKPQFDPHLRYKSNLLHHPYFANSIST